MHPYDIIGYVYQADTYCPYCTAAMFSPPGGYKRLVDTETILDRAADALGIDRYDEYGFDSDHFPKVIFCDQFENDRCGECHEYLIEPFDTDDEED